MSFVVEWDCNNTAVLLFHSVLPLLLLLSLPSTQLLGYGRNVKVIEAFKMYLQVHMDPQGQPSLDIFHAAPFLSPSLILSAFSPGVSWRLGLMYTLCHMLHAATVCQFISKATEGKKEGGYRGTREESTERRREVVDLGCAAREGQITIFSAALLQCAVCSIIIYCREREREGCSVMQEGGSKGVWKKRVKGGRVVLDTKAGSERCCRDDAPTRLCVWGAFNTALSLTTLSVVWQ